MNMLPSPAFVLLLNMMPLHQAEILHEVDFRTYPHCHVIKVTARRNAFA
jgi:hypothetical protein